MGKKISLNAALDILENFLIADIGQETFPTASKGRRGHGGATVHWWWSGSPQTPGRTLALHHRLRRRFLENRGPAIERAQSAIRLHALARISPFQIGPFHAIVARRDRVEGSHVQRRGRKGVAVAVHQLDVTGRRVLQDALQRRLWQSGRAQHGWRSGEKRGVGESAPAVFVVLLMDQGRTGWSWQSHGRSNITAQINQFAIIIHGKKRL